MLQYICDKQGEVRQAASYGVGVMAQFGGAGYAQACAGMLIVLSLESNICSSTMLTVAQSYCLQLLYMVRLKLEHFLQNKNITSRPLP